MKHIIFNNKKIYYKSEGKGKPVMLIHGFAEDNNIWKYQASELQKEFCVIIPDLPGSGHSELLEGNMQMEDYAEVLKAIADAELDQNNFRTFTLIGHSMGGYVALAFAEKYSILLNGFGLFHSTAYADDDEKKLVRQKGINFIKNHGVESFLQSTSSNLFSPKTKDENPEMVSSLINDYKNFNPKSLQQYYEAMMQRPDRTSVLRSFAKPVLFIIGKNDKAVPLASSLQQCYLPSVSYVSLLQNAAHMGMWEEQYASNEILKQFFSDL